MNQARHTIGWIGMGRMGYAMAYRLLKGGCDVGVWNRTRAKAEPLTEYGATVVDSILDLASRDIVFTMVSTTADLQQVLFGPGGLVTGERKPRMVIDSSSISEDGSAEVRAELARHGVQYLAAPVSGNAKVVKAGKLAVVTSGPRDAHDIAQPYLAMLGRGVTWLGEGELARIWKIAHNTMFGVIIQSLCEITVLAEKAGIPRHAFLESINNSVLGSMYTRYKTPALVNLDFSVTFTPKLLLKDLDLGLDTAHKYGVPMPTAAATRECVQNTVGRGHDDIDFSVLLVEQARNSGYEVKSEDKPLTDGLND
jgi:3-hydroxyisobutyrate dehydrogenase